MTEGNGVRATLADHERRLAEADAARRRQWEAINRQGVDQVAIAKDVEHIRGDVAELADAMKWLARGAWAGAATFAMLIVTIAVAILQ